MFETVRLDWLPYKFGGKMPEHGGSRGEGHLSPGPLLNFSKCPCQILGKILQRD